MHSRSLFVAEVANPENPSQARDYFRDPRHVRPWYPEAIIELCRQAGFTSARIFYPDGGGFTRRHRNTAQHYAVVAKTA
jgi:hypothetical protein